MPEKCSNCKAVLKNFCGQLVCPKCGLLKGDSSLDRILDDIVSIRKFQSI